MVRRQLEGLMAQIEEVTRLQEKIVAGLAEVKDADKMAPAQKAARQMYDAACQRLGVPNDMEEQGTE